jgi:hypothetical protein
MRDTIDMAREAGLHLATEVNWMPIIGLDHLKTFEALVRADEREACAKLCDGLVNDENTIEYANGAYRCSVLIRSRGEA